MPKIEVLFFETISANISNKQGTKDEKKRKEEVGLKHDKHANSHNNNNNNNKYNNK